MAEHTVASLETLPDELLFLILSEHTPLLGLASCALVCRRWRRLLNSRAFRHYHNARFAYIVSAFEDLNADVLYYVDLDLPCIRGRRPLHAAVMTGDASHVDILLHRVENEVRPDDRLKKYIDQKDDAGHTPLSLAVAKRNLDVVRRLADLGANMDAAGSRGRTPIHLAVEARDAALVKLLLSHNVRLDVTDRYGMTPLHLAAGATSGMIADQSAPMEIVRMLLDNGADPTAQDFFSQSPLHIAALTRADVFEAILNRALSSLSHEKLRPSRQETSGCNIGSASLDIDHDESADCDSESNTSSRYPARVPTFPPSPSPAACGANAWEEEANGQVRRAHDHPASLLDRAGYTPLHRAAETGNLAVMIVVLRHATVFSPAIPRNVKPVDVDVRAPRRMTSLHLAAAKNYQECVRALISVGADVNAEDASGRAPLDYAKDNFACAQDLALAGAKPNHKHRPLPLHSSAYIPVP